MKNLLVLSLICFTATPLAAQTNNRFEIKGNIGYISDVHMAESFNLFGDPPKITSNGIYSADALIKIGDSRISVIISYGNETLNKRSKNYPDYRYKYTVSNYLIGAQYNYNERRQFYMYSGLEAGFRKKSTLDYYDYNKITEKTFAYDLTIIGLRSKRNLGFFGEVGFGAKGWVRAGISYAF